MSQPRPTLGAYLFRCYFGGGLVFLAALVGAYPVSRYYCTDPGLSPLLISLGIALLAAWLSMVVASARWGGSWSWLLFAAFIGQLVAQALATMVVALGVPAGWPQVIALLLAWHGALILAYQANESSAGQPG